jgi:DNA-directed RNA polymerase specialized sigma24 family protein
MILMRQLRVHNADFERFGTSARRGMATTKDSDLVVRAGTEPGLPGALVERGRTKDSAPRRREQDVEAISVHRSENEPFELFYAAHVEEFSGYLRGVLGGAAEGRGGRVSVEDALQEAMLRIHGRWDALWALSDDERDRRLHRLLRDAAGKALRREYGDTAARGGVARVIPFDFTVLDDEHVPEQERELNAMVLGAMARDIAASAPPEDRVAMLDRGVLLAGLSALTEREIVALIAVDYLGWDQVPLAARLGTTVGSLYQTLFGARKLFYSIVRHAVGIDIDDEERARLCAYLAGELTGKERRAVKRHLRHCTACQTFERERRVFASKAQHILAPLPFLAGGHVLHRAAVVKPATGLIGAGKGLLAQAGAGKALAVTAGTLTVGFGFASWASIDSRHHPAARAVSPPAAAGGATATHDQPPVQATSSKPHRPKRSHVRQSKPKRRRTVHHQSPPALAAPTATSQTPATSSPAPQTSSPPATSSGTISSGGDPNFPGL